MPNDRNRNSVLRQLARLQNMSLRDLKEKWKDLYGDAPPNYGKKFITQQLAYRIQELFYGGLKKDVKKELLKSESEKADAQTKRKSMFALGTRFVRVWNNEEHEVSVVPDGFEYEGQKFRSLTAVAEEITGSHWNGRKFFGLPKMNRKPRGKRMKRNIRKRKE